MEKRAIEEIKKAVCTILILATLLSGCAKQSDCQYPTKHVHKYVKNANGCTITAYFDSEDLSCNGFNWTEEFIEKTNGIEDKIYEKITDKGLYDGEENWGYLYSVMCSHPDFLKFYYYYETTEYINHYKTVTDSEGRTHQELDYIETRQVPHDGWTTNPHDSNNTGRVEIWHTQYYGYEICVGEDGKATLKRSPFVDDIRDLFPRYKYIPSDYFDDGIHMTSYEIPYKFSRSELPKLDPYQFSYFEHPDLDNPTKNKDSKTRIK